MKEWQQVLDKLKKNKNPLYDLYKDGIPEVGKEILFSFPTEEAKQAAQKKWQKLQKQLPPLWQGKRITYTVGVPQSSARERSPDKTNKKNGKSRRSQRIFNPLQALNHTLFSDRPEPALIAAVKAEDNCEALYKELTQKTEYLATETFDVEFIWRVRVGGIRGFRELLLPVFHPVYGVPYVPSSSLKGVLRAWARQHQSKSELERLLGTLDDGVGCVQIFDAFPLAPCLDVDMATPQWTWDNDRVTYQPAPHALLSMLEPTFKIGVAPTSRGTSEDARIVRDWLKEALSLGIGSRVGSGYGRTTKSRSSLPHNIEYAFQLRSQGMYGAVPPTKENRWQGEAEFRPTALRGVLRYWFRAVALSLYSPTQCKDLEGQLFGAIEPQSQEGSLRIAVDWTEDGGDGNNPHLYEGIILLEAKEAKEVKESSRLKLLERLLILATHLGGMGRGSRRSLHWNDPYPGLRGCYWQLEESKLPYKKKDWLAFIQDLKTTFLAIAPPAPNSSPSSQSPGKPKKRYQDVLDSNTRLFLVLCPGLKHPEKVRDWPKEGKQLSVRGEALDLLYSSDKFKGRNQQGRGNENVGGGLKTPSFVTIQSNFPDDEIPYQAVTVFGANQRDRAAFVTELKKLTHIQIL
ncbi:MAG: RAMP superfamily CRISPR-associated protein [Cyanobacteria bacterium P01_E01_bin.42]